MIVSMICFCLAAGSVSPFSLESPSVENLKEMSSTSFNESLVGSSAIGVISKREVERRFLPCSTWER